MKVSGPALIYPAAAAIGAGWLVSTSTWEEARTAVLPALSVITAAVLVRLARGLPFTNADHFTLATFRQVAGKLRSIARKLRTLVVVEMAAMALLIVGPGLVHLMNNIGPTTPTLFGFSVNLGQVMDRLTSALIGASVVYGFVRIVEVIQTDVSLLKLQTSVLESAIAAKNGRAFEKTQEAKPPGAIVGAEKFGAPLQ